MEINVDSLMRNSFAVLTHRCEVDDILDMYKGVDAMFYGNPLNFETEDLEEMLKYFEETEEYENCKELKELIDAKNIADLDMFLEELRVKNGQTEYWI